jgi:hypothetical protein
LSPFSATIVQNSSNLRNDWNFAIPGCIRLQPIELDGLNKGASRNNTAGLRLFHRYPRKISLLKSDPFMALAAKGAVDSCAELDHCHLVAGCADTGWSMLRVLPREQAVAFSRPRSVGSFNGAIHPKTPARFAPGFSLRLLHEARRLAISRLRKREHAQFRHFYFGRIRA